jgi:hypothetical protein
MDGINRFGINDIGMVVQRRKLQDRSQATEEPVPFILLRRSIYTSSIICWEAKVQGWLVSIMVQIWQQQAGRVVVVVYEITLSGLEERMMMDECLLLQEVLGRYKELLSSNEQVLLRL